VRKNARLAGEWLAGGVPLLNIFLLFISSRFRKSTVLAGAYVARHYCGSGVAGGHPPTTRQHKCVLAASSNRFWPSVLSFSFDLSSALLI
jgi:hypothetical protein